MNSRQDMVPCGFLQIAGAGAAKGQLKISCNEYQARCDTFWFSVACSWWSQGPIEYW
jgi:hypothetical protein